ncbi:hypothetical protein N4G70_12280 [Streptomyces sp. ASQP_92]|uniref:hypothetical protein n=1 Tax=Streptomyces sp. ASQP_92 TaxID=2979116 RepID=UPI0021C17D03|nr:hypothetical protein [Streptomyces sp. ASQP_92]MCT9089650.1 hypothetical protein [Streptomyces sp. ASQP_92]
MIDFIDRNIFHPHPELLIFDTIALGFLLGKCPAHHLGRRDRPPPPLMPPPTYVRKLRAEDDLHP